MDERTLEVLWIGSFRYHLGRRTYAVSDFVASARAYWPLIPSRAQSIINRELKEAIEQDDKDRSGDVNYPRLGDTCDRYQWDILKQTIDKYNQNHES